MNQHKQSSLSSYTSIPNAVTDSGITPPISEQLPADKEAMVRKPVIPINYPCQVGHPDHEKWLEREYDKMSNCG